VTENAKTQAEWNCDGYSGLDSTKGSLCEFKVEWLGVGLVEFYIIGRCVHVFSHPNTLPYPYMKTAILPLSFEIVNTATHRIARVGLFDDSDGLFWEVKSPVQAGGGTLTVVCNTARILNGVDYATRGFGFSHNTTNVSTTILPLWSIRPKATLNGITSRAMLLPTQLSFFSETQPGAALLILNPTLTGATWAATSPSAAADVDTAATVVTGGTTIWRVGQGSNTNGTYDLKDLFTVDGLKLRLQAYTGTADILTMGVVREATVNFDPRITMNWREIR
jgi:hypothetical protein